MQRLHGALPPIAIGITPTGYTSYGVCCNYEPPSPSALLVGPEEARLSTHGEDVAQDSSSVVKKPAAVSMHPRGHSSGTAHSTSYTESSRGKGRESKEAKESKQKLSQIAARAS